MKGPTSSQGVKARRRAARAAGKLTAREAGARLNASPPLIRKLIAAGEIAADPDGMIDPGELDRIRERFPCHEPGCPRVALGPSGYCHDHKATPRRGKPRTAETRAKIGDAQRGVPKPRMSDVTRERWADPEQREALEQARRKGIDRAKREVKREVRELGGLDVKSVVKELRQANVYRTATSVRQHIEDGLLEAQRIPAPGYAGRGVYVIPRALVAAYAAQLREHPDGRSQRFNFESPQERLDWYVEHWPHKKAAERGRLQRQLEPDKPVGGRPIGTFELTDEEIDTIRTLTAEGWSTRRIEKWKGIPRGKSRRLLDADKAEPG